MIIDIAPLRQSARAYAMRRMGVVLLLMGLSAAAPAQNTGKCATAKAGLESFLAKLPRSCTSNADCDGYYYRVNSCAAPVVLRKPGVPELNEPDLLRLQSAVRESCRSEMEKMGPCAPQPYRASCVRQACVDSRSRRSAPTRCAPRSRSWASPSASRS